MQIEFDPAKDVLNIKNHGLSLAAAAEFEWVLRPSATMFIVWCLWSGRMT